ncbi:MAG: MerR family transcriptional regulator [Lachnospiraceae bacterium]
MTIKEVSEKYNISPETIRYYERVGAIPPVTRTAGGIRNFSEEDIGWLSLATCMRGAGLPIEILIQYLKLYQEGDSTIPARYELLKEQRDVLLEQRKRLDETLDRLNYKIARYEAAIETGTLTWERPD